MAADRLADLFAGGRDGGRAVFMPYLMAGLPADDDPTAPFRSWADAGADAFEVGIPYTDPLMDGPVIQKAAARALAAGMTFERGLSVAGEVGSKTGKPVIVMTYINPILATGPEAFARNASAAGVDGVIVADLPFEEARIVHEPLAAAGVGLALFASPTTSDERLLKIVKQEPAFIYGVTDMGVTGARAERSEHVEHLVRRVRAMSAVPLVLGVGISTPDQARYAAGLADGVIVGTALVNSVMNDGVEASAHLCRDFADAVHGYDGG